MDCFIPKFKLKYDDLENIKTDRVNTVVFNLNQIKQLRFLFGTPGKITAVCDESIIFGMIIHHATRNSFDISPSNISYTKVPGGGGAKEGRILCFTLKVFM